MDGPAPDPRSLDETAARLLTAANQHRWDALRLQQEAEDHLMAARRLERQALRAHLHEEGGRDERQ